MYVAEPAEALVHARVGEGFDPSPAGSQFVGADASSGDVSLSVHDNLADVADEWRALESGGTVFQTFLWHALWQKHIGAATGVIPAIVVGRRGGRVLFVLPLAIEPGRLIRRLVWHACDLCDYNAPLVARDFVGELARGDVIALFGRIKALLCHQPKFRFDAVLLDKMPETVGEMPNPMLALRTTLNPSGAYLVRFGGDWESFYRDKRSSGTRRHDRTKRKRLGEIGEVRFATAKAPADIERTLAVMIEQKRKAFGRMGVADLFARPGVREFFLDFATTPEIRDLVHVSRLDVGDTVAAANFGMLFGGRYYHVVASYNDGAVARFGPGIAHLHDLMRHAIERGCREFDFTIGDEPYKREWTDVEMRLHDYRSAETVLGLVAGMPGALASRVKRFVKRTPVLWRGAMKLRALIGSFRRRGKPPADGA